MKNYSKVIQYFRPVIKKHWRSAFGIPVLFVVANIAMDIVAPLYYKKILDEATSQFTLQHFSFEPLLGILSIIIFLKVGGGIIRRAGSYFNTFFSNKVTTELVQDAFRQVTQQAYVFFSNNFVGTMTGKVVRIGKNFRALYDILVFDFFLLFFQISISTIIVFQQHTQLGWFFLGSMLFFVALSSLFIRKQAEYDHDRAEKGSRLVGVISDIFTNILNTKIFSSINRERFGYFGEHLMSLHNARRKTWLYQDHARVIKTLFSLIFELGGMYITLKLFVAGDVSVGTLALVQVYIITITGNAWHLDQSLVGFIETLSDAIDAIDIVTVPLSLDDPKDPESLHIKQGSIHFENVSFTYPDGDHVFENFNLIIPEGQSVGIVGKSGSGKTTITKLLLRFYDVDNGQITIDGQNVASVTQDDLRSCISYIPQESILFHRSIRENIGYAKPDATQLEIEQAAAFAHADEFINQFAEAYDTKVGERGVKLSGGQRQRIAIARAMLKHEAPLLVMDEATSSLDSLSERYIQESFETLMKGKTTLVVAHRLSTIQKMDRIIVLDDGKIIEDGSHADLLKQDGYYATLWRSQSEEIDNFFE